MKVGDLVTWVQCNERQVGIVVDFDHEADGVLCFILAKGNNSWYRKARVEVVSESR